MVSREAVSLVEYSIYPKIDKWAGLSGQVCYDEFATCWIPTSMAIYDWMQPKYISTPVHRMLLNRLTLWDIIMEHSTKY